PTPHLAPARTSSGVSSSRVGSSTPASASVFTAWATSLMTSSGFFNTTRSAPSSPPPHSRQPVDDHLRHLLTLVLLKEVAGAFDRGVGLVFGTGHAALYCPVAALGNRI